MCEFGQGQTCGPRVCNSVSTGCAVDYCKGGLVCSSQDVETGCGYCIKGSYLTCFMFLAIELQY